MKPADPGDRASGAEPDAPPRASSARHDLVVLGVLTVLAAAAGVLFDIGELTYRWTRHVERFQLDELPAVLFVLACGLAWFAWRRYRESQRELAWRDVLETKTERLLAENRQLASQAIAAQETERRRLARELHDELGQYLNSISLDATRIRDLSEVREPEIHRIAAGLLLSARHVYREIGGMVRRLRPIALDEFGLPGAIEHCVESWRTRLPGASFSLTIKGDFSGLADTLNLTLYRVVQEALTNVSKFARHAKVEIYLIRTPLDDAPAGDSIERNAIGTVAGDGEIVVTVRDDGAGVDLSMRREGLGLIGIRERVEALGGEFHLASQPACGFLLCARVPVHAALLTPSAPAPDAGEPEPEPAFRPDR